jgi:hypothetical protein
VEGTPRIRDGILDLSHGIPFHVPIVPVVLAWGSGVMLEGTEIQIVDIGRIAIGSDDGRNHDHGDQDQEGGHITLAHAISSSQKALAFWDNQLRRKEAPERDTG